MRLVGLLLFLLAGCEQPSAVAEQTDESAEGEAVSPGRRGRTPPAGATCRGRDDCSSDQACVEGHCRHRRSSTAGEILAAGAKGQLRAGDFRGAIATYRDAIRAFERAEAPIPAEVACGAAGASLRAAEDEASREAAAAQADRCFRTSLPGDPARREVQEALARLRFDGLDIALFDQDEPPSQFFTQSPSRPTADAIVISVDLARSDRPGFSQLKETLLSEAAQLAISDCFIQDWEIHHEREATAALVLRFQSLLRDMGDYDTFNPEVVINHTSVAQEGFEPCLARALSETLRPGPRLGRPVSQWQEPFTVGARIQ
ncbi:MAG: hypothetical protein AAGF12_17580 [Myxococcota bacterium]